MFSKHEIYFPVMIKGFREGFKNPFTCAFMCLGPSGVQKLKNVHYCAYARP